LQRSQGVNSQFIRVPLDLRDPYGLALLSCLINCTPGTVWVEILPGTHDLALHIFDLQDEQWWIDTIKREYEGPLMEIFEGKES
jgi:multicomponent K+:H+ antiporter subunit E